MCLPRAPTTGAQPFAGSILPSLVESSIQMRAGRMGTFSLVEGLLAFGSPSPNVQLVKQSLSSAGLTPPGWVNGPGEVLGHKEEGEGLTHAADSMLISRHGQTLNKCVWECHVSAHQALLTCHGADLGGWSCPLSLGGNWCLERSSW